MGIRHSIETKLRVYYLRKRGWSYSAIIWRTRLRKSTIANILKSFGARMDRGMQPEAAPAEEIEVEQTRVQRCQCGARVYLLARDKRGGPRLCIACQARRLPPMGVGASTNVF